MTKFMTHRKTLTRGRPRETRPDAAPRAPSRRPWPCPLRCRAPRRECYAAELYFHVEVIIIGVAISSRAPRHDAPPRPLPPFGVTKGILMRLWRVSRINELFIQCDSVRDQRI
ncbi:hypothetical protein EVAR_55015_1 [Eumeta japonica]|uniref:Uncharacterized protein n=1 Tax=Eumeta variegata TaxID=151549 RepID=A0A4C1YF08_EUMVA|nr:hypothetical protein EVAR_55015_1 [Eumeta japonica]